MKEINFGQGAALTAPAPLVLVCTQKRDGRLNMAPVSFFMFASFNPPMLAFAMGRASNTGENLRRTGKAVIAVPGSSLSKTVMVYGSVSGAAEDKLARTPCQLQSIDGGIDVPADCRAAFTVSLAQTIEAGDHYLYLCNADGAFGDETKRALFAWQGYTKAAPAEMG